MQFTLPIVGKWDPEQVIRNLKDLRSEIKWKNFELNYDPDIFEKKGYFVFSLGTGIGKEKSTIHIWRNRVQITSPNWLDYEICFVFLSALLQEGNKNTFLESIIKKYKEEGEFPPQFLKSCYEVIISLYIDLVEGKVPKEMVEQTKKIVQLTLLSMLEAISNI